MGGFFPFFFFLFLGSFILDEICNSKIGFADFENQKDAEFAIEEVDGQYSKILFGELTCNLAVRKDEAERLFLEWILDV